MLIFLGHLNVSCILIVDFVFHLCMSLLINIISDANKAFNIEWSFEVHVHFILLYLHYISNTAHSEFAKSNTLLSNFQMISSLFDKVPPTTVYELL